ncbi:Ornithine/acetylornithine aminotransferase [Aminobacter sp. MSH1]|uniref:helicase HerA-like domain-containing protein n=1 Tax=Aminobacter sp. MSH1 TaxID=374606 RepID=UPI000D3670BE|nr:helicase HerA-like domain-containing protein [Aminobacter sp. MSH1]AWC22226.1 Ornithine/acetylornithine aminotransferase [Aminobacter sp. MSH1]
MKLEIGQTASGKVMGLPYRLANRHGLVTGATGTGKTVTLQRLAEQFSAAGIPVFAADVKGDLSGIAAAGDENGKAADRAAALGRRWAATSYPVALWDIFGKAGLPVRTSVQDMGAQLLSRMLGLNQTQEGAMEIAFRKSEDERSYMLTLNDLRWTFVDMLDNREEVSQCYGNVTASSISAIQRNILALEAQGGAHLFGEPPFDILDFMATAADGRGVVNLLHADKLMEAPKLYATFLLWLLGELFRKLPEAGDLAKPKLVFFFDEAHLLFNDAPKPLVQQIERLVRLVRSKGIGVFFVTQSPQDVPDTVLAQLGTRIQHALRAYTPSAQRMVRAAADAFRPNRGVDVRAEITTMGIGEALISVMEDDNIPTKVEKVRIIPPSGQIGMVSSIERQAIVEASPVFRKYRAGATEQEASYAFDRRMKQSRGIDPVPETAPAAYEPGLYRKYLPTEEAQKPPHSIKRQLLSIVFWGGVAWASFKIAGFA